MGRGAAGDDPTWDALPVRPVALPSPAERAAAIARQAAWAAARGARFDALELGVDATGNSTVRARRPLHADEPIVTIPRHLILTDRDLAATPTGEPAPFGGARREPLHALASWLALEVERADSPWQPFLAALPVQFPDVPTFRGGDDLAPLAGTAALLWAADNYRDIVESHRRFARRVRKRVSLAAYAWGRAIVASRGFNAPFTMDDVIAFIPIVDLMDHRRDETSWAYDPARGEYTIHAVRDFAAGEPVHFTYGAFGNARLLSEYGFALPDNPYDETVLEIDDELFAVTAREDVRWDDVRARTDRAGVAAATRRALARLDAGEARAATAAAGDWQRTCALVRRGERRALGQILAWHEGDQPAASE